MVILMNIDPNYESPSDELDLSEDESQIDSDNNIAEFELDTTERKNNKHNKKRNYDAMRKIEQLEEERRLKKCNEDYYDDWD